MANTYQAVDLQGESGGGSSNPPYFQNITAAGSWNSAVAFYEIIKLASSHNQGSNVIVSVYELVSGEFEQVETSITVSSSGNVTIAVSALPDLRFDGKIIIKGE